MTKIPLFAMVMFANAMVNANSTNTTAAQQNLSPFTQAIVTHVTDGDTVKVYVKASGLNATIRLQGIDAPELNQPHGKAAQRALQQQLLRKQIRFVDHGHDKYRRTLATIWLNNQSVNGWMVAGGHAWAYLKYLPSSDPLIDAEKQAKNKKLGLWQQPNPIAPWLWRKMKKQDKEMQRENRQWS